MTLNYKYQTDTLDELDDIYNSTYDFSDKPINRFRTINEKKNKSQLLQDLKNQISQIDNCQLKTNAKNLVFSDGDINSSIMIVGEGPGQRR